MPLPFASWPFQHSKADIILRSSDNVDFRVFRLFLSLASSFFETLFELPQPSGEVADQEMRDGLAVVPVSETSKVLDAFLRFCYPSALAEDPDLDDLTDIVDIFSTARKYSLDIVERKACKALRNPKILTADPLRCFALARHMRLEGETLLAAWYTLKLRLIPSRVPELNLISATELLALLDYHRRCGAAVAELRDDLKWITNHYGSTGARWLDGSDGHSDAKCPRSVVPMKSAPESVFLLSGWQWRAPTWWLTYLDGTFASLRESPSPLIVRDSLEGAIRRAQGTSCQTCTNGAVANMTGFIDLFAKKVERVVAKVQLHLDF
ncbi:hypothetical protein HYDPIDRAFT_39446 [Hydnomerulius pinastri MD-312]|nr:hypothetical protein HYDPIDRAFT_39446 [Hydnomerulius pinastri MD-312]